ncbi:hydantoinase/oxoprolinase family protein [Arthrobacter sp. AZCC_0090]|uniref:hydantoinase/oxoprolinase family protein n=1 Tax=Arthrobacter sp. AZCC_0090 TaxID=2735881 RepID=UPI00161F1058|nr:hydantoinase/oxoprolinase family protein [Arthrobacter sp. AZCC_0090]MBB6405987.1 N-methylhydantoinase A [Arthrobacter sp. AZCC_0090]
MTYRVAMDIGGTFTDVVAYDENTGTFEAAKSPTTPRDLTRGMLSAIDKVVENAGEISFFVHGTTQGLNALLERKGSKVLLLSTQGMRDVYHIARGNRDRMFDLHYRKQQPLVQRADTTEVRGRLNWKGEELEPLDEAAVVAVAEQVKCGSFDAVAVALLFSYLNPAHELRVGQILRQELPADIMVVLSHEVAREWREYERTSTAVLEAYTGPVVRKYLSKVQEKFSAAGMDVPVQVMQSSGGVVNASFAREHPLQTLLSGPVGGTAGGAAVAGLLNLKNAICVDMGGTSFDVSLVLDGKPDISHEGDADGFPLLTPLVKLHTIGAGGGSLAYAEAGGLRVGPESSGATPGPACYGNGGTRATVTDANCLLGRVDPTWFAGGSLQLDVDAATSAIGSLAAELNLDPVDLAGGIVDVANAKMAQAIRTLTVEHGLEPQEFTFIAFGGAGPMHAEAIAQELGIREVVIPRFPGAFSAWGMIGSNVRRDFVHPFFIQGELLDQDSMVDELKALGRRAGSALEDQGIGPAHHEFEYSVQMRYQGQDYALTVPLTAADEPAEEDFLQTICHRFGELHESRYGHSTPDAGVEFVSLRVSGRGLLPAMTPKPFEPVAEAVGKRSQRVIFQSRSWDAAVLRREELPVGETVEGPAVIVEGTSTTVISPSSRARVDENGFLIIEVGAK